MIILCLSFLIANGVFGDEVKSVLVTEGYSITLHTDVIKHSDDLVMWYYGSENTFVARINGKASSIMYSDDERFKDRLELNNQTGDLTITHITSQHSGLYTLKISSNNKASIKIYNLNVYGEVSVREGHSVILYTHVLQERDDVMEWTYGPENTLVARIDGKANSITFSDDERFRNRVKRDDQTGALMINVTTTHHSGLYKISINNKVYKRFNVTISGEVKSVSVKEGHSATVSTHDLKERDDLVGLHYGSENTLVARIDGKANSITFSDDERFKDRVKRDDQTGDLMIHDITTHHSGLYKISINNKDYKRFNVTVSGEVKSVREGHSVILYTHVLKERDDLMEWHYGPENTLVARIDGKANSITFSNDERFRNRVKMDDQTGALMIHDTTTHQSGLYKISINNKASVKIYNLTICGEVKSVREGHSVILYSHVLKERDDLMEWHYGPEDTLVARIDGKANSITFSEDERFRNRVKMDEQTGALMIHDTTTHQSGLYKISINKVSYKTFEVTIHNSYGLWLWVVPVVCLLLLLICVCVLLKRWQKQHKLTAPRVMEKLQGFCNREAGKGK